MRQARIPVDEDGVEPQVCVIEVGVHVLPCLLPSFRTQYTVMYWLMITTCIAKDTKPLLFFIAIINQHKKINMQILKIIQNKIDNGRTVKKSR